MIDVAIIGASGYTGVELIKILFNHPKFNITYIATSKGEDTLINLHPFFDKVYNQDIKKANALEISKVAKIAFLALPHKTSMGFAKELLKAGKIVIDLSADYRFKDVNVYEKWYKVKHSSVNLLNQAVYGLPEINRKQIKQANLIANPGCYPTASILGLVPFVDYIDENFPIFIDAKSGVSGAGKNALHLHTM